LGGPGECLSLARSKALAQDAQPAAGRELGARDDDFLPEVELTTGVEPQARAFVGQVLVGYVSSSIRDGNEESLVLGVVQPAADRIVRRDEIYNVDSGTAQPGRDRSSNLDRVHLRNRQEVTQASLSQVGRVLLHSVGGVVQSDKYGEYLTVHVDLPTPTHDCDFQIILRNAHRGILQQGTE